MKRLKVMILSLGFIFVLSGCENKVVSDATTTVTTEIITQEANNTTEATTQEKTTRVMTEATTEKSYDHVCEASGCTKEGTKSITGISGATEYYCTQHYNEIQSMIGDMENDVGNGSESKHTCEASGCTKEGTHSLTGLGGDTEYYCTQHYSEIVDMLNEMYED